MPAARVTTVTKRLARLDLPGCDRKDHIGRISPGQTGRKPSGFLSIRGRVAGRARGPAVVTSRCRFECSGLNTPFLSAHQAFQFGWVTEGFRTRVA